MQITTPNCKDAIVVALKKQDYEKGTEIFIGKDVLVLAMQDGKDVGYAGSSFNSEKVLFNKKTFKGLKKGLFSKTYQNVVLFWVYHINQTIPYTRTYTTEKGRAGTLSCSLKVSTFGFKIDKFYQMLNSLKIKYDQDQIIITEKIVWQIINDRIKDAMKSYLDLCPNCTCSPQKGVTPPAVKTFNMIHSYVQSELEKIGVLSSIEFLPLR